MNKWLLAGALLIAGCAQNAAARPDPTPTPPGASAEHGAMLFRNKGCITCHVNTRVPGPQSTLFDPSPGGPPNLTAYHNDPAFLRRWLSDPKAVKPGTFMPNLQLSPAEIDDLIAFLNAPR